MKRTAEIVLSVLGILVYILVGLLGVFTIWLQNNQAKVEQILQEAESEQFIADLQTSIESIGNSGILMIVFAIIAVIAGIVAIILVKGNKKPKAAGITLIATAVIVTIASLGAGIIGGIFYLISGILCFVRKDKQEELL